MRICKFIIWLVFGISFNVYSQTNHITQGDGGFENTSSFIGNGWTVVNSTVNSWMVGGNAISASGANSAYVSNDGSSFQYTNNISQTSHFYRDITIPAGQTFVSLSFKIKCLGEPFFDRLLVYTAPTNITPVINDPLSSSSTLTGATLVYSDPGNISNYTNVNLILNPALAGTTFRLIFTWQNDATGAANSPVSVDDITLISSAGGPLNGIYTINPLLPSSASIPATGSNFSSFASAINYLNTFGVSGNVEFLVPSGSVHNEPLINISATGSSTNQIRFIKDGTGINPVIIPPRGISSADAAVRINGGDYITFDGIDISANISPTSAQENIEYGYHLRNASATNGSQYCTVKNANITLSNNYATNVAVYIQTATAPSSVDGANSFNTVDSITVLRAYTGIRDLSNATTRNNGNVIKNCVLGLNASNPIGNSTISTASMGIHAVNPLNITLKSNTVGFVNANNAVDGIYIQTANGNNSISHNKISGIRNTGISSTATACGIRITINNGARADVFNNFVYDISHAYTTTPLTNKLVKGISIQPLTVVNNSALYNVDFNSVQIDGTNSPNVSTSCLDVVQSGPIVNARNNILSNITPNQAGNPAHYCITVPTNTIADLSSQTNHNDFYCPFLSNGFVGQTATTNRASLVDWQTGTGRDLNSLSVDPQFASSTNLHVFSSDLDSAASLSGITWITDDIDGDARLLSHPDIGADEFSLLLFDIEMQALIQPVNNSGCFGTNQPIQVRIKNLAGQSHDFASYPVFVQVDISGPVSTQLLTQINDNATVGGPLGSLQTLIYDAGVLNMTQYGDYTFRCKVFFPQDQNFSNDSLASAVVIANSIPIVLPSSVDFNSYNGTNLSTVFPDWDEALGQLPTVNVSSWTSASGLGGPSNVSARLNQSSSTNYNWILSKKIQAAFNTILKFDVAVCTPFAFTPGTMAQDDKLDIMISTDCGLSFFKIDSFDFNEGWDENLQSVIIPLGQFQGQDIIVGIRAFDGITVDGNYDLHIDNILLFNSNDADLSLNAIINPIQLNCYADSINPMLRIENRGFTDINFSQTPLYLNLELSETNILTIIDSITSGILLRGNFLDFEFANSIDMSLAGEYLLKSFITLSGGDVQASNDTLSIKLISQNPSSFLNASSDTFCLGSQATVFSGITLFGAGINDLPAISYQGLPVAIPDNSPLGVSIPLLVTGVADFAAQIVAVEITSLTHQFIGDIKVELISPNGSSIVLTELFGISGNAYTNTIFRMNASQQISTGSSPFTGTFLPIQNFSELSGTANGTWFLRVSDLAAGDIGSISAWNLIFKEPNSISSFNWQSTLQNISSNSDSAVYNIANQANVSFSASDIFGCPTQSSKDIYVPENLVWNQAPIILCGINNVSLNAAPAGGFYSGNGIVGDSFYSDLAGSGQYELFYFYEGSLGCIDSASITATVSLLDIDLIQTENPSCFGSLDGSIAIAALQNLGNVSYQWSDSNGQISSTAINLAAGNYTVTVTDTLCSSALTVTLTEPTLLSINSNTNDISCFGSNDGSISINPSGGTAPYSFIWDNNASTNIIDELSQGNYNVTLTDENGCELISDFTIITPDPYNISFVITDEITGNDAAISVSVTGANPNYNFLWSNGETNQNIQSITGGDYSLTITDANNCDTVLNFNVPTFVKTDNYFIDNQYLIYPNPANTFINITKNTSSANVDLRIIDISGREVFTINSANLPLQLNLSDYSAGVYIITLKENNLIQNLKFVKKL